MITTKRKTGFLGFLTGIRSVRSLYNSLVVTGKLNYILTYKLSQDHLELFFGAVRAAGGFNNNPNAIQFVAAYKRLFMRSNIKGGKRRFNYHAELW